MDSTSGELWATSRPGRQNALSLPVMPNRPLSRRTTLASGLDSELTDNDRRFRAGDLGHVNDGISFRCEMRCWRSEPGALYSNGAPVVLPGKWSSHPFSNVWAVSCTEEARPRRTHHIHILDTSLSPPSVPLPARVLPWHSPPLLNFSKLARPTLAAPLRQSAAWVLRVAL